MEKTMFSSLSYFMISTMRRCTLSLQGNRNFAGINLWHTIHTKTRDGWFYDNSCSRFSLLYKKHHVSLLLWIHAQDIITKMYRRKLLHLRSKCLILNFDIYNWWQQRVEIFLINYIYIFYLSCMSCIKPLLYYDT